MSNISQGQGTVWTKPGFVTNDRSITLNTVLSRESCSAPRGHSSGSTQSPRALKNGTLETEERARWGPDSGVLSRVLPQWERRMALSSQVLGS